MTEPLLRIVVHGQPGTAGSKSAFPIYQGSGDQRRFTGRVTVAEKDKQHVKRNWRQAVMAEARALIGCGCPEPGCTALRPGFPLDEALVAAMVFTVKKPTSAPKNTRTWPTARPDVLKYSRATEDALTAAGVLRDDSRVVDYTRLAKVFPREDPHALDVPGAVIWVWRKQDLTGWAPPVDVAQPSLLELVP